MALPATVAAEAQSPVFLSLEFTRSTARLATITRTVQNALTGTAPGAYLRRVLGIDQFKQLEELGVLQGSVAHLHGLS
jgi:hypothetical protein